MPPVPGARPRWRRPAFALQLIAAVALLAGAAAARDFLVPVVVSVTLTVLGWPVMRAVQRVVRLRVAAAAIVVVMGAGVTGGLLVPIASQVSASAERMPEVLRLAAKDVQRMPGTQGGGPSVWQRTQQALEELDRAVARATGTSRAVGAPAARANSSIVATVTAWSSEALAAAGRSVGAVTLQAGVILLLTFFLLCSGDRLVTQSTGLALGRSTDPTAPPAPSVPPLMTDIALEIRRFGAVTLATNLILGVAVAAGLWFYGVEQAWLWGLTAAALHFVPYAGLAIIMALAALEVYALSASVVDATTVALYVLLVGGTIGTALVAWLQGKASHIDSALTFGGTVFFSVLWGGWGLVLGPLMVVIGRVVWRHSRTPLVPPRERAAVGGGGPARAGEPAAPAAPAAQPPRGVALPAAARLARATRARGRRGDGDRNGDRDGATASGRSSARSR